jgi:hypothetical protein
MKKVYFVDAYSSNCNRPTFDICCGDYHSGTKNSNSHCTNIKNITRKDPTSGYHIKVKKGTYIEKSKPNSLKKIRELRIKLIHRHIKQLEEEISEWKEKLNEK